MDDEITVGVRVPHELFHDAAALRDFVADAEEAGIDRLFVGDHVTFKGGQGFDGLLHATALAALSTRVTVQTAVYLLPLRHPVPVARQVASLAGLAPGRVVFGVGVGGEDPAEYRACGVDPATRGRRMDEAIPLVRALLGGAEVSASGEFFTLDDVSVRPAPEVAVPIMVGGRSDAALRRTAEHGDGWLGLWTTPERYAASCARIAELASARGRQVKRWGHGMHVWCGFGDSPGEARPGLATMMERLYRTPFEKFERYSPYGTPEDVAAALLPYVRAGCRSFNLITGDAGAQATIEGAVAVRTLLRKAPSDS
ncbi:LLM class flavin-dependent oxidoreductase [Actinomadura rugatobispora]|uniref:LLM class flavin-dependent oxidoreductase n=1 Tax=Actinomadura rugatobispora TaxID=1994 RepID=A0ABW0ZZK5_9ACTN|nr:TIGR03854 family LLM class F420-dependent oxidoreductase [Actinomadura rugatobispora]